MSRLCLFVMLVIRVSCTKKADHIKMPFGRLTHVCPRNHALDVGSHPHVNGYVLMRPDSFVDFAAI